MKLKIIFVDGYNVLNSWPGFKSEIQESFENARKKLTDVMHNYGTYTNSRVILVFDGYKVNGNMQNKEEINKNLTIVYTKDGETADSYIERNVHLMGRRAEIYVVTSDGLEQQTIFQRGAARISSLEFYNEIIKMNEIVRFSTEQSKSSDKNHLQDNVDLEVLKKLEEIRRGHF